MECPTQPVLNKPSWHHEGPRKLDNVFEHWFIRNDVAPGWSAAQGGIGLLFGSGESSNNRGEYTDVYLNRKSLVNPEGGPQQAKGAEIHAMNARRKLFLMDLAKMEEYNRRRKLALIDARNKRESALKRISRNIGWPLREAPRTGIKDEALETANVYAPPPAVDEYLAKWEKSPMPSFEFNPAIARLRLTPDIRIQITARTWIMVKNKDWHQKLSEHKRFKDRLQIISPTTDRNRISFYVSPLASSNDGNAPDTDSLMKELQDEMSQDEKSQGADWYKALLTEAWGKASVEVRTEIDKEWCSVNPGYIEIEYKWDDLDHEKWSKEFSEKKAFAKFNVRAVTDKGDKFKFLLEPKDPIPDLEEEAKSLRSDIKQKAPWYSDSFLTKFEVNDPAAVKAEIVVDNEKKCIILNGELLQKPPAKWIWKGPEKTVEDPEEQDQWTRETGTLDLLLWKPLSKLWPEFIEGIGAKELEKNLFEGKSLPDPTIKKRAYAHQYQFKDLIDGEIKTITLKDGREIQNDIVLKDYLTGIPIYEHFPNAVQLPIGHGLEDPVLQLDRKKAKIDKITELIQETREQIEQREIAIKYYKEKFEAKLVPKSYAVNKIIPLAKEIEEFTEKTDSNGQTIRIPPLKLRLEDLKQRLKVEQIEMRALEDELAHRAKISNVDFLPKSLAYQLPLDVLGKIDEAVGQAKSTINGFTQEVTKNLMVDRVLGSSDHVAQDATESGDKYFGRFLVDPATGREDMDVVNRKNSDMVARNLERNKALADVLLSRSDGMQKFYRPTKDQMDSEKSERRKAQRVVDDLVGQIYDDSNERSLSLEQWADSEARKKSVFGSSVHNDTSDVYDPAHRMKNYAGSIGKWKKQIIVDRNAYKNYCDEFYLSLKPIKNPSEMSGGGQKKQPAANMESFDYPPPLGGIPFYTPQISAQNGLTPNSTLRGCYFEVVKNQHDTKFDRDFAAAKD